MKLRDATPADAARLDELLTKLIHDEAQYDSNLNGSYVVTDNYLDRIGLEGHKLLLIEDEGEIIAFLYGFLYEIPGMFVKPIAILDALYVEEAYRRKGCAAQLISAFKSFAAESGTCRVELKVRGNLRSNCTINSSSTSGCSVSDNTKVRRASVSPDSEIAASSRRSLADRIACT